MEIKEGEGAQVKGIVNIVNKIIGENTPNLEKEIFLQIEEALRMQKKKPHLIL